MSCSKSWKHIKPDFCNAVTEYHSDPKVIVFFFFFLFGNEQEIQTLQGKIKIDFKISNRY